MMLLMLARPALAGPPYVSDDPEPTDYRHFEIYFFDGGTTTRFGTGSAAGIDFNYGAAPDLQLTAVLPAGFDSPLRGPSAVGLGNIQLAAKYRLLHQSEVGLDLAVFPRVFLPAGSNTVGSSHVSLFLPIWIEKDFGAWTTFGGGGYEFNRGEGSKDFYQLGWAVTREITHGIQLGAEAYHQSADIPGGESTSGLNAGFIYDINDNYHLMGTIGPGIQNANDTNRYSWYVALLVTF
jgi:hypothetical protein